MLKIFLGRLGLFNKTSNISNLKRRFLTYSLYKSTWNLQTIRINWCQNMKGKMWINTLKINFCKKLTANHTHQEILILHGLCRKMCLIRKISLNLQVTTSTSFRWLLTLFLYKEWMRPHLLVKLWPKFLTKTLTKKRFLSSIFIKKKSNKRLKELL